MITLGLSEKIEASTFPAEIILLNLLGGMNQGAKSIVCPLFLTLGQSCEATSHLGLQLAG